MIKLTIPKLVVCAGGQRSGSTWAYNIVRYAFLLSGYSLHSRFIGPGPEAIGFATLRLRENEAKVLKMHHFNQDIADKVKYAILTRRDFRDVIASYMRRNSMSDPKNQMYPRINLHSEKGVIKFLDQEVTNIENWQKYANIVLNYEDFYNKKIFAVENIISVMGLTANASEVLELVESLELPTLSVDKETELWPNHITHGGVATFDSVNQNIIKLIENRYPKYVQSRIS